MGVIVTSNSGGGNKVTIDGESVDVSGLKKVSSDFSLKFYEILPTDVTSLIP